MMPPDETTEPDVEELEERRLCFKCVGEEYLKHEIRRRGRRARCSYCMRCFRGYSIGELAERIEEVFEEHYYMTSDQPSDMDYITQRDWERDGEPVVWAIANAAQIPEEAATDIQQILADKCYSHSAAEVGEESEFEDGSYYAERGIDSRRWHEEWRKFEEALRTEARFFSQSALRHLTSVFDGLDAMRTRDGRPVIVEAGPEKELSALFRARVFQSMDKLEDALRRPDKHLGSPPSVAAAAGRMNARGIAVFYGATDPGVALSEVRPPVGSKVAVAKFEIIRPLQLLDLTALRDIATQGSIFDRTFGGRLERAAFLGTLTNLIARPVMPDDEAFEYLTTQAVADFLATESNHPLDGIIYPSVQVAKDSLNVVLFHKAAGVQSLELPKDTDIDVSFGHSDGEYWDDDYSVTEWVPPEQYGPPMPPYLHRPSMSLGYYTNWDDGERTPVLFPPTLKIDLKSVCVHEINAVRLQTVEHEVARNRYTRLRPIRSEPGTFGPFDF
jgi:hypothetical protein